MSELSDMSVSIALEGGRDDTKVKFVMEPEYENVSVLATQAASSHAARETSRGKLLSTKKPKPGPKPSYVAVKIAELNLKQKMNGNELATSFSRSLTTQPRCVQLAGVSRADVNSTCRPSGCTGSELARHTMSASASSSDDDHIYDSAITVTLDCVVQSPAPADSNIYDDAVVVSAVSPPPWPRHQPSCQPSSAERPRQPDERRAETSESEPVYDDATAVDAACLHSSAVHQLLLHADDNEYDELEPVYAEPDELVIPPHSAATSPDHDRCLYDEALPVNIPSSRADRGDETETTKC